MRKHPPYFSLAFVILFIAACSNEPAPTAGPVLGPTGAANVSIVAATPADLSVTTTPAAGSSVQGPLNQVTLDFSAPVALTEVLITGPDGIMPMMLSPAGVQARYSVPVPGLQEGRYTLAWKATLDGQPKSGSFAFTIK
ncbi:MAG: copper resistance CopC family protein [Sphingomicrobium sp.]